MNSSFRQRIRAGGAVVLLLAVLFQTLPASAAQPSQVEGFPLNAVQLLDGPFKLAMERNAAYLLSLEPDRFLHNTRKYAGLEPKAEIYGGWESQGIAGHSLGHYLTAISLQFSTTGDHRFKERIDYTVSEMAKCQKRYGDGYIGALPPKELETLRALASGKVNVSSPFNFKGGAWVPWYTQHKVLAGLMDAWVLGGNPQAKEVVLKLADWVDTLTGNLTDQQLQEMLWVEHGGMLETLMDLYALTGNPKHLDMAHRFYQHAVFDPLLAGKDQLTGLHANTQIPKIVGEARAYEVAHEKEGRQIAEYFWKRVAHSRSWVIGGNSNREHFFPIGEAADQLAPETAESCNTYNMLKLTEHLFAWDPKPEYADFYERALFNHILASQEPDKGMFAYFMSLKPGHFKTFSTPHDSFWCCVGSGMENHTKYGKAIYFHSDHALYVNLFIPSVLHWKEKGLVLEQRTKYPYENTIDFSVKVATGNDPISLFVRCPGWGMKAPVFRLNGTPLDIAAQPGEYAEIKRVWRTGDELILTVPMQLRTELLEEDPGKIAFLYGPLVLAADLGPVERSSSFPYAVEQWDNFRVPTAKVPVLVLPDGTPLMDCIEPEPGSGLVFRTVDLGQPNDVVLRPFKDIFYNHYNVYWDVLSQTAWDKRAEEIRTAEKRKRAEEARTVDVIHFGEQQPEIDHEVQSHRSHTGDAHGRKWRDARDGGWFEFKMKVLPDAPQVLRCTYWGSDGGNRAFDLLIDGKHIATQKLEQNQPGKFFDIEYPIPAALLKGKNRVTVRLETGPGMMAGGLFGAATMKVSEDTNDE